MPAGRFVTDDGMVDPAVSAETMREVDRIAFGEQAPNLFQMMENAGRSLALTAIDHLGPGWHDVPIAVLAGRGGNGGGGIRAARHLANHGGDLMVVLAQPDRLSPVTRQQLPASSGWSTWESRRRSMPGRAFTCPNPFSALATAFACTDKRRNHDRGEMTGPLHSVGTS